MLLALMIGSLYVLRPFLPGLIWATTIVVATWPVLLSIQRHCGGRRWLATVAMLLILLFVIVLPLYQAISTLALHGGAIMAAVKSLPDYALLAPPAWIGSIPLAGPRIAQEWQTLSDAGAGGLLARIEPYLTTAAHWLLGHAAIVGVFVMHMLITVIIAGILYSKGDIAADFARRFANRLAGQRGVAAIRLAASAIRAVALGIVVTAVVQSALGGIGLWIAGVPAAGILTALMVMLCLAQLGPFSAHAGRGRLAVPERYEAGGRRAAGLGHCGGNAGQPAAASADQARGEPVDAADSFRRVGRHVRLRHRRIVHWSGDSGGDVDAAQGLDR